MGRTVREPALLPIQPGELIYSLVARLCEARQILPTQFNIRYLGHRVAWISHDLPSHMPSICRLVPNADIHTLFDEHTLLPFLTATQSFSGRTTPIEKLSEGAFGDFTALGSRRIPRATFLRYCPACETEDRDDLGFAYWKRVHQLPTNLVCAKHQAALHVSPVSTDPGRKIGYATAGQWGDERPTLVPAWTGRKMTRCIQLAKLGSMMLDPNFDEARSRDGLRTLAAERGYGLPWGEGTSLKMTSLAADIEKSDSFLHRIWPNLGPAMDMPFSWLAPLLTPSMSGRTRSPFTWAILKTFLESPVGTEDNGDDSAWGNVFLEHALRHQDTKLLEEDIVDRARNAAREIRARVPETRVTLSEILRLVPVIRKRRSLARVRDALDECVETSEQFELRRIRRGIQVMLDQGRTPTVNGVRMITNAYSYDLMKREIEKVLNAGNENL